MEDNNVTTTEVVHQTGKSNHGWIIASLVTLVIILLGYIMFTQFMGDSATTMSPTPTRIPTFVATTTPTMTPAVETTPVATKSGTPSITKAPTKPVTKTPTPTGTGNLVNPGSPTLTPTPMSLSN